MQTPTIQAGAAGPVGQTGPLGEAGPAGRQAPQAPQAQQVCQVEPQAQEQNQQQANPSSGRADDPQPALQSQSPWPPEEDSCIDAAVRKQLALTKDCEPSWKAHPRDLTLKPHGR